MKRMFGIACLSVLVLFVKRHDQRLGNTPAASYAVDDGVAC